MTEAVFHAPMSALNADANRNACEPRPPAVHADGKARACVGADAWAPNRTRTYARKDNTWLMKALYFKTKVAHG